MTGLWIIVALLILIFLVFIFLYNLLVSKRIRCREEWAQIDVQLKRRWDLIPNLVETVRGYAAHERETLERVTNARSAAQAAKATPERTEAENVLSGALRQLFALSEHYPGLKANQNFAMLQEEIANTENKIAFSRKQYNTAVAEYNTAAKQFPTKIVADLFNFRAETFFELDDPAQRELPQVKF